MRYQLLVLLLFALLSAAAIAAEPKPSTPAQVPRAEPLIQEVNEAGPSERLVHLKAALAHLERAGFEQPQIAQAARIIGALIDAENSDDVPDRASTQVVEMQIKVFEVNKAKLRAVGFDWSMFRILSDENAKLAAHLEALAANGLAKVISEPQIRTVSGREATFEVGNPSQSMTAKILPTMLKSGKIQVRVECNLTRAVPPVPADGPPGTKPRTKTTGVMTTLVAKAGEPLVLTGLWDDGPKEFSDRKSVV